MNVKQFAQSHGISEQAVYQRLKRYGVQISTFKDRVTKQLNDDGIKLLQDLFSTKSKQSDKFIDSKSTLSKLQKQVEQKDLTIESLQKENEVLQKRVEELENSQSALSSELESTRAQLYDAQANCRDYQNRVDALSDQIQLLSSDVDHLRDQLTTAHQLANNAQHLQAAAQQQLQAMIQYQQLPAVVRFFRRLTGKTVPLNPDPINTENVEEEKAQDVQGQVK